MNKLAVSHAVSGGVVSEGVSFDGATDYLSRDTDLVGNVDSKTFTFSCWVYWDGFVGDSKIFTSKDGSIEGVTITISNGSLDIALRDSSNTNIVRAYSPSLSIPKDTWVNLKISVDTSNSSNRGAFINDTELPMTWTTYTDDLINSTFTLCTIGTAHTIEKFLKGRLSNIFLAYEYIDLSIEANRRLFITEDGKPTDGLASLNPILYLPMKDKSTAHINEGTGGDFVQNGLLETADRGANQDNCVASEFDGVDDYLSSTGIGASDGKQIVISFVSSDQIQINFQQAYAEYIVAVNNYVVTVHNSAQDKYCRFGFPAYIKNTYWGKTRAFSISINTDILNGFVCIVDGVDITNDCELSHWDTGLTIGVATANVFEFKAVSDQDLYGVGDLGELYFDTNYIDLATNNPFWDSDTNKPIPVRKAMATLGSNPLICMPTDASNPTKNYGSGGDFTLYGGGLTGARGASEFIARTIVSDASDKIEGNIFCKSLVKWIDNVVSYHNDVTITASDVGTVGYYFGFSDDINWTLESNKNLITNQLGYPRLPTAVISESGWSPILGLFFEDSSNLGLNTYGADFSVTGSPTNGADINK